MPDIAFWNKCNNKCVMCTNMASFALQNSAQYGLRVQIAKMESYLAGGGVYAKNADKKDFLNLTGGEPTIHPDFFKLLYYFRKRLPGVWMTLLSNGRHFADASFSAKFLGIAHAPFSVAVPLHGPDAKTHDPIAGVRGSFAQTMAGLRNLFAMRGRQELEIRLVLHKKNISAFSRTLEFLLKTFPGASAYRVVAMHYEIEGMSLENSRALGLKLGVSAEKVNAALPLIKRFADFRLYHFPLCLVRKELRPLCRVTQPAEDRAYPAAKCGRCRLRKKCPGLMIEYEKKYGCAELRTVKK